jgi:cobalt-zinc-cadmium efflux system outer membrane protein
MASTRVFALCAVLLSSSWNQAQQSPPATVEDLVRIGITQNKDLLAVRERIAEARGTVRQAGVRPAPTLNMRGVTGRPLGTLGEDQYGADFSQTIELFGKRSKRIEVANFEVAQAEAELQQRASELAFLIRTVFADRSAELNKVKLFDQLTSLNQEALRLTDARVREGDTARLDANLLRVEINRGIVLRRGAQARLAAAELNLSKLVGIPPGQPLPELPANDIPPSTLDELKQKALEARADLKAAQVLEQQNRASAGLARANGKPDVNLSAGYTKQNSQFDDLFGQTATGAVAPLRDKDDLLSFGVSIPLRTSRSTRGEVESALARTSAARLRREYLERTIPLEVESAYQQWTTARESLDLLRTGVVDLSTDNLRVIQEAYRLGQLRLLDVVNEQRRLIDNQVALIDARGDAARGWAEVERAIGGNLP